MAYENECFKCHKRFFAMSKWARICVPCKTPAQEKFDQNEYKMIDRVTGEPVGFPPSRQGADPMESVVPMKKDDPRRAKDFVACADQACEIHARVESNNVHRRELGWPEYKSRHCHPVF